MKKLYFALLALLLLGCQSPKDQNKATSLDCFVPRNDGETADEGIWKRTRYGSFMSGWSDGRCCMVG